MSRVARRRLLGLVGVVGLLALWETGARLGLINTLLLSSPSGMVEAGLNEAQHGTLWPTLWTSFLEFALGMLLSAAVGIGIGLLAGWYRRLGYAVDPWLTILYATPAVALVPLIITVLGIDLAAKVFTVFLFAVFPIAVNTTAGVHATANRFLRVAKTYQASESMKFRTVILPGATPYILMGLRVAGARAIVGVVIAELVAGNAGIGYMMNLAATFFNTGLVMFLIAVLGLTGVVYSTLLERLEEHFEQWRPEARRT